MMTSNNSSLLKDSQELTKTKGTIWKPLIAVSLLSVFSFTAGQYLPYVIIAVSGSGAIAAVPLAIFAVSAVVALISVTYLVKLAISRDDNKKEAGLNGQEFGHTPSQEPQKFVCKNCTNLENKSNVPTPQSPPVTFGTQPNPSANMLQPPPPPLSSCASPPPPPMPTPEQLNQTSGAVPPPPPPMPTPEQLNQTSGAVPPPPPPQNSSTQQGSNDLLNSIKKAGGKPGMSKEQKKARDEKLKQNREKREKNSEGEQTDSKNALLAEIIGGFKLKSVNKNQQSPEKSTPKTLNQTSGAVPPPPPPMPTPEQLNQTSGAVPPPPPPMPTPEQLNQTSGAVPPPPPPMPTPEQLNQTSGAVPPPPPPQNSSTQQGSNDLLNSIKKAGSKPGMSKEQKKARDEKLKQNREKREKNSEGEQTDSKNALLAEIIGGFKLKSVNKNQQSPEKSTPKTLNQTSGAVPPPPPPMPTPEQLNQTSGAVPPPPPPMPTPEQLNQTSGAVPPPPPPMPTPEQLNQTSGAVPPPPPPQNSSTQQGSNDLLNSIKKAGGKPGMSKEQKKARDEKLKQNREKREKNSEGEQTDSKNALLAEIIGGFKLKSVNKNQQSPEKSTPKTECDIAVILARRVAMECSDSESESSSRESGWSDEGEQEEVGPKQKMLTKHRKKSMPSNPQSFHKERSKSPDSGHVSGDDAKPEPTSPSHPAPEAGKPPIPPKPAGLQTKPEAPPVKEESPVSSEMKDPSTLSVKDHIKKFGGEALRCKKENVVQRL